jgi:hypothetical protein
VCERWTLCSSSYCSFHRCHLVSSALSSRTLSVWFQRYLSLRRFNAVKSSSRNRESFNLQTGALLLQNSKNHYFTQKLGPRALPHTQLGPRALPHTQLPQTFKPNIQYTHYSTTHARIFRTVSFIQLLQTKFCRLCIFNFLPHATRPCFPVSIRDSMITVSRGLENELS